MQIGWIPPAVSLCTCTCTVQGNIEGGGARVSSARRHRGPTGQPGLDPPAGCAYRLLPPRARVHSFPSPPPPYPYPRRTCHRSLSLARKERGGEIPQPLSLSPWSVEFHLTRSPRIKSTSNSPIQQRSQPSTPPHDDSARERALLLCFVPPPRPAQIPLAPFPGRNPPSRPSGTPSPPPPSCQVTATPRPSVLTRI